MLTITVARDLLGPRRGWASLADRGLCLTTVRIAYLSVARYAAILSASFSVTPISGMALPGTTACGVRIHVTRLSDVFGSIPAMYFRYANNVSGGPAMAS